MLGTTTKADFVSKGKTLGSTKECWLTVRNLLELEHESDFLGERRG